MKKTLGALIAQTRKEKGMTQLELAEKLGVTDKAVSKWERELSCPDIQSLPTLAEALGLSLEELMQGKNDPPHQEEAPIALVNTILRAVALAMGVAVVALSVLDVLDEKTAVSLLGLGLASLALYSLQKG